MADISIQFHALPGELLSFLREIVTDFDVHVVALTYQPFRFEEFVTETEIKDRFSRQPPCDRLHFTLGKPSLAAKDGMEFGQKNRDSLRLDVGAFGAAGLVESWLCARTLNPSAFAAWENVAKRLKRNLVRGAIATSPHTGRLGLQRTIVFQMAPGRSMRQVSRCSQLQGTT
jgi:hypothetical protein